MKSRQRINFQWRNYFVMSSFVFYLEFTDELVVLSGDESISKALAGKGPFVFLGEL